MSIRPSFKNISNTSFEELESSLVSNKQKHNRDVYTINNDNKSLWSNNNQLTYQQYHPASRLNNSITNMNNGIKNNNSQAPLSPISSSSSTMLSLTRRKRELATGVSPFTESDHSISIIQEEREKEKEKEKEKDIKENERDAHLDTSFIDGFELTEKDRFFMKNTGGKYSFLDGNFVAACPETSRKKVREISNTNNYIEEQKRQQLVNFDNHLNQIQESFEDGFNLVEEETEPRQEDTTNILSDNLFLTQPKPLSSLTSQIPRSSSYDKYLTLRKNNISSNLNPKENKIVEQNMNPKSNINRNKLTKFKSMSNLGLKTKTANNNNYFIFHNLKGKIKQNEEMLKANNKPIPNENIRKLKNKNSVPILRKSYSSRLIRDYLADKNDNYHNIYDASFSDGFDNNAEAQMASSIAPQYIISSSPTKTSAINYFNNSAEDTKKGTALGFLKLNSEDNESYVVTDHPSLLTPQLRPRKYNNDMMDKKSVLKAFREPYPSQEEKLIKRRNPGRLQTIKQEIDSHTPLTKGKMHYNPKKLRWEGNVEAVNNFPEYSKPLLISKNPDFQLKKRLAMNSTGTGTGIGSGGLESRKKVGSMIFDSDNLRWVSANGEESEENPFKNIDAYALPSGIIQSSTLQKKRHEKSTIYPIGNDKSRRCYSNIGLANTDKHASTTDDLLFTINSKKLELFYHEENIWSDSLKCWVNNDDALSFAVSREQAYEIRKMVLSSTKSK
ncbi:Bfa1p SCDLUD_000443 [Saccharomycodes ludwigii]|uniref:Bfa1p n=1 Tax=Saccharomycodes ludwigii TaxID=36035 RepID=UPI001E8BB142|nr:hypothetical protein SCDLUD_000443 [Saccharomycodes ludwigii]KAH3902850.1 hypothetical protein SCDLUD_000443 [Saccharomycodes ludwigii]